MFELSFAKIFVIGVVALIVLGPEKLPAVARMAGTLLGRAQRFLASVKEEVNAQAEDSGLHSLQEDIKSSVENVRDSMHTVLSEVQQSVNEIQDQVICPAETPAAKIQLEANVDAAAARKKEAVDVAIKPNTQADLVHPHQVFAIIAADSMQKPKQSESTLPLDEHPPL